MSDLIRREDAREAIEKLMEIHFDRQVVLARARDAIASLPSAEPKTGEWHNRSSDGTWATVDFAYCSECKQPIIHKHASPLWRFCPNCGARMEVRNK